jgi:hypothetical protein
MLRSPFGAMAPMKSGRNGKRPPTKFELGTTLGSKLGPPVSQVRAQTPTVTVPWPDADDAFAAYSL